jgi:RNA polymerase sigma-70 factor (ECF subfamily)
MEEGSFTDPAAEARARELFDRYQGRLAGFFKSRGLSHEDTLELTQDAIWRVLQNMGTLRSLDSLDAFVMRVAANLWKNALRYRDADKRGHGELSLDQALEDGEEKVDAMGLGWGPEPPDALAQALSAERLAMLRECLDRLASRRKSCLDLHVFQRRPYQEIATLLRISIDSVKSHIHQARQKLRECLRRKSEGSA